MMVVVVDGDGGDGNSNDNCGDGDSDEGGGGGDDNETGILLLSSFLWPLFSVGHAALPISFLPFLYPFPFSYCPWVRCPDLKHASHHLRYVTACGPPG